MLASKVIFNLLLHNMNGRKVAGLITAKLIVQIKNG